MRFILTLLSLPLLIWAKVQYLPFLEINWFGWLLLFFLYVWAALWALDSQIERARPGDFASGGTGSTGGYGGDAGWGGGFGGGCDGGGGGGDGGC